MDDLGTPHLRFERVGSVGWCTVDRPEARNALTSAMYLGVRRAVDLVNSDPELAALVITGVGDVFIPGGEMSGRHDDGDQHLIDAIGIDVLPFRSIRNSRAPVVAAVNGICQGGGLIIAMSSDVAVASDRATFRAPETLRGIVDANLAALLPAHLGVACARDLLMSGRRVDAHEARTMGLVSRVVPHDDLRDGALAAVGELLRAAPDARSRVKAIINSRYGVIDEITFQASLESAEIVEGFRAFTEKRSPDWVPEEFRAGGRL
ncbi:MAG TPA: enoyl-CoA hydratase/isomerase family protein [Acidimicrobiia bacterium]